MKFKIYFRILSMIKYFQMQNLLEFLKFTEKQTHQFSFLRVNLETLLCKKMFVYFSLAFLLTQWLPFLKNKHLLQNNYCIALVYHPFCQILEYLCESLAMPHSFFPLGMTVCMVLLAMSFLILLRYTYLVTMSKKAVYFIASQHHKRKIYPDYFCQVSF